MPGGSTGSPSGVTEDGHCDSRHHALSPAISTLIIGGGDDIQAHLYGAEMHLDVRVDPERDDLELQLLERFIPGGIPVLGICRGAQLINVHLGGTLDPDIYTTHEA